MMIPFFVIYPGNLVVRDPHKKFFKRGVVYKGLVLNLLNLSHDSFIRMFLFLIYVVNKLIGLLVEEEPEKTSEEKIDKCHEEDLELPFFDFATIGRATNDFSSDNRLGEGGFGPVYRVNKYINRHAK